MKPWKLIPAFVVVFLAGAAVGGAVSAWMAHRFHFAPPPPEEMTRHIVSDLRSRLDLDPEQVRRVEPVVAASTERITTLHRVTLAEIDRVMDESNAGVVAVLRPAQAKKFEEMEARRRKMMRAR